MFSHINISILYDIDFYVKVYIYLHFYMKIYFSRKKKQSKQRIYFQFVHKELFVSSSI